MARRTWILIVGLVTIWPALYTALFLGALLVRQRDIVSVPLGGAVHVLTIALVFGLVLAYGIHAYRDREMEERQRLKWIVAILVAHYVAVIFYWYFRLWRRSRNA